MGEFCLQLPWWVECYRVACGTKGANDHILNLLKPCIENVFFVSIIKCALVFVRLMYQFFAMVKIWTSVDMSSKVVEGNPNPVKKLTVEVVEMLPPFVAPMVGIQPVKSLHRRRHVNLCIRSYMWWGEGGVGGWGGGGGYDTI